MKALFATSLFVVFMLLAGCDLNSGVSPSTNPAVVQVTPAVQPTVPPVEPTAAPAPRQPFGGGSLPTATPRPSTRSATNVSAPARTSDNRPALVEIPSDSAELKKLKERAVELINRLRASEGLGPLTLSDNPAAQVHAQDSLENLYLAFTTTDGFTSEMLHNLAGGDEYVKSFGTISGFITPGEVNECRLPLVRCADVNPEEEVESRLSRGNQESGLIQSLLRPQWDSVSIGIAHTDLTFVMYEYLERSGVSFVEAPVVSNGFLTMTLEAPADLRVRQIGVFYHPMPESMTADELRSNRPTPEPSTPTFTVHRPPEPGFSLELSSAFSKVADLWEEDGSQVRIAVDASQFVKLPGVYELVVWPEKSNDVPLAQHHVWVSDLGVLARGGSGSPVPDATPIPLAELKQFVLELVNKDRADFGAPPVVLGDNPSAQAHADDALEHGYIGHWTIDGLKPYMLYQQHGGIGVISENAATTFSTESIARCQSGLIVCNPKDPKDAVEQLEWAMMYDDAESDWGHRDTIINPKFDTVNVGIAHSDQGTAFYQHFEFVGLRYQQPPSIRNGVLTFWAEPLDESRRIVKAAVHYDPLPEPQTPEAISQLVRYCTGGGFTDQCDDNRPVFQVLIPAEIRWGEGFNYVDLRDTDIVAERWIESQGSALVEVDVSQYVSRPGVYTVSVLGEKGEDQQVLSAYPVFVR